MIFRKKSKIKKIKAREILDSRGNPTVQAEVITDLGSFIASAPSGASTGKYEAVELRDGGKRYKGKGVLKAVKNVNQVISPALLGKDPADQEKIDNLMVRIDGTQNKSKIGANAIVAVSMACCRAGAAAKNIPLYSHIKSIAGSKKLQLPVPCFNVINGGAHAGNDLDFQEFMVVPQFKKFSENLQAGSEVYHTLKEVLKKKFGGFSVSIGDEGGFAPPISSPEQALDLIQEASLKTGYKVKIILDVAASQFYNKDKYCFQKKERVFTKKGFLNYYQTLTKKYPIIAIEDPFSEEDWGGWKMLMSLNPKFLVIGDDLLVTNVKRIREANRKRACNGLLLKVNQIGTVTEAIEAANLAKLYGWKIMVSHRSGETKDDFIADLAVGVGADFIKSGAPARGERVAKYNRLLKIEKEIK